MGYVVGGGRDWGGRLNYAVAAYIPWRNDFAPCDNDLPIVGRMLDAKRTLHGHDQEMTRPRREATRTNGLVRASIAISI